MADIPSTLYDDEPHLLSNDGSAAPGDPHDQASAALTTLFAQQEGYNLDLSMDPTLASAEGATASGDSNARHQPADSAAGHSDQASDAPPAKRKATSRAHMLARGGACEFCKRRKLKCTAELPQCAACRRTGRDCEYKQKKQRSRVRLLEDKLADLEKRLIDEKTRPGVVNDAGPSSGSYISPDVTVTPSAAAGVDLFGLGIEQESLTLADVPFVADKTREPDLMTLADAAAADTDGRWAWDGLEPQAIAAELVKVLVHNGKGVGEKILHHLLQLFSGLSVPSAFHSFISPAQFFARLHGHGLQPHPALVMALVPLLLSLSPSATLSNLPTISAVTDAMMGPSRLQAQHALGSLDERLCDITAAASLRSVALVSTGRFVDSWQENATAIGLTAATGLSKLGGVGENFVPASARPADRAQRVEREKRLRDVRLKGQIGPPPRNVQELGERIILFWGIYISDRACSIGWNYPAGLASDEITTPLPQDSYDTPEAICSNATIADFLAGDIGAGGNGRLSLKVKTLTLTYEASRLLDRAAHIATPDKNANLLRTTRRFMASLPVYNPGSTEEAIKLEWVNELWMSLHVTMMLLFAKEEIDAPSYAEELESRDKMIDSGLKMCDCIEASHSAGNFDLHGHDPLTPAIWFIAGRAFHHLARRIEPTDKARAAMLRQKVDFLVACSTKLSNRLRLAEVHAQMLYNVSVDAEVMLGEYSRPDNLDF